MQPAAETGLSFAARVAAFYAAIFVTVGVQLPFFPLWLKAEGFDARAIGVALAIPQVTRLMVTPWVMVVADRRDALRGLLVISGMATLAASLVMGLASGTAAILLAFFAVSVAWTPIMPLTETYALKGLRARGRAYGPVRLWGSAAFVVGSFGAGLIADWIPARHLIWLFVANFGVVALTSLVLQPMHVEPRGDPAQGPRKSLLRDPAIAAVLAAAGLIQGSHALFYGFSTLAWTTAGLDGTTVAALWALGVIAEIVLFALSARLPPFFTPGVLLMIGAGGAIVRWAVMAFDPPFAALPFLQCLHALSFGATHLGTLGFLTRHAPPGQAASVQGALSIVLGLAMAASTSLSGLLFAAYGSLSYAAMALAALAGGACGLVAHRLGRDAPRV